MKQLNKIVENLIPRIDSFDWKRGMEYPSQVVWTEDLLSHGGCLHPNRAGEFKEFIFIASLGDEFQTTWMEAGTDPAEYFGEYDFVCYKFVKQIEKGLVYKLVLSK